MELILRPMRVELRDAGLAAISSLDLDAALGLGEPSEERVAGQRGLGERGVLRAELEQERRPVKDAAAGVELDLHVDVDHLAVDDEDAVVEFGERKDVHARLALEHVIVHVLEGYGLARRGGERHLRDLVELGNVKNIHLLVLRVSDFHRVVDRDVAERFRVLPLSVRPHEADASMLVLVEPVDRALRLVAEADVEDAVDPLHEVRVQLLPAEELARRLESVAVDLCFHRSFLSCQISGVGLSTAFASLRETRNLSAETSENTSVAVAPASISPKTSSSSLSKTSVDGGKPHSVAAAIVMRRMNDLARPAMAVGRTNCTVSPESAMELTAWSMMFAKPLADCEIASILNGIALASASFASAIAEAMSGAGLRSVNETHGKKSVRSELVPLMSEAR